MIEQYNNQITNRTPVNIIRSETIRGGVNIALIERIRQHYRINGYPEPMEYENQRKKVKIKSTIHYGKE